jgi:hypothetical protein
MAEAEGTEKLSLDEVKSILAHQAAKSKASAVEICAKHQ